MKSFNWLLHPITIFVGIGIGVYLGLEKKFLAEKLSILGDIYLGLLQMCVLPIMISAVISSIGRLLKAGETGSYIKQIILIFIAGMLTISILSLIIGGLVQPGSHLSKKSKITLSKEIVKVEGVREDKCPTLQEKSLFYYIKKMIPDNIFHALSEGDSLPVLFFSLLIGIAFGVIKTENTEIVLKGIDATYEAMLKIISWIMYGLPFGLCFIFAGQMSKIGIEVLKALFKTVLLFYGISVGLLFVYTLIIWVKSKKSFKEVILAVKEPLIVAFGTSSSFASIPAALKALNKGLGFEKQKTDLIIPLGISLNPHGNVLHFVIVAIFMLQLYGQHLTFSKAVIITLFSPLAAIAATGAPGIAALSMLSVVLEPLGVPVMIATILFTAIDPIIDPVLTALNVYGNCAACALLNLHPRS